MWPFKKRDWKIIGFADLGWTNVSATGKETDGHMRVTFHTRGDDRTVEPTSRRQYDKCLNASVFVFTECKAWEDGGPLPSTFQRVKPEYTKTDNIIHLKAKE